MMIERLDRVGWPVFNVDETMKFFSDLFGITFEVLPAERIEVNHDALLLFFSDLFGITFEVLPAERIEVEHHDSAVRGMR